MVSDTDATHRNDPQTYMTTMLLDS